MRGRRQPLGCYRLLRLRRPRIEPTFLVAEALRASKSIPVEVTTYSFVSEHPGAYQGRQSDYNGQRPTSAHHDRLTPRRLLRRKGSR